MKTILDLYNLALLKAGSATINDPDGTDLAAEECRRLYPECRDEILRLYNWPKAIRRIKPPSIALGEYDDWAYAYRYPVDCIKIINTIPDAQWTPEGTRILSDTPNIIIRYIARIEDPQEFDDLLFKCLTLSLAAELCSHLTHNTEKKSLILQELQVKIIAAQNEAGIEARRSSGDGRFWDEKVGRGQ